MSKYVYIFLVSFIFSNTYLDIESKKNKSKVNVVPILGQINNGKYIKGLLLTSLQGYSIYKFSDYNKNNQISKRNTYAWWILGLYFYGVIDAYVDSSLKNFPNNEKKDEVNK